MVNANIQLFLLSPRHTSVGLQVFLLNVQGNLFNKNIRSILDMEADYNILSEFMTNKLLIPRGEKLGYITEKTFGIWKTLKSEEVAQRR